MTLKDFLDVKQFSLPIYCNGTLYPNRNYFPQEMLDKQVVRIGMSSRQGVANQQFQQITVTLKEDV